MRPRTSSKSDPSPPRLNQRKRINTTSEIPTIHSKVNPERLIDGVFITFFDSGLIFENYQKLSKENPKKYFLYKKIF